MPVKVKICGITKVGQALEIARFGADALGFIFHKKSPRFVSPSEVKEIIEQLPSFIKTAGVTVNLTPEENKEIQFQSGVDLIQLHGDETPEEVNALAYLGVNTFKAFRIKDDFNFNAIQAFQNSTFLFDAWHPENFGGTGETLNWNEIPNIQNKNIILAGGLTPNNIREAIQQTNPYGVDVSSGVEESPGIKNLDLVEQFISAAKGAK